MYRGDTELESDAVNVSFFVVEHTGMFERQWREFLVRVRSREDA
jgi:hypothetical protein